MSANTRPFTDREYRVRPRRLRYNSTQRQGMNIHTPANHAPRVSRTTQSASVDLR